MKAIQTEYRGTLFRSKTEARWAVFFDSLGVRWKYEHEGYELPSGKYLPDFWLPDQRMYLEIKGQTPTELEQRLCYELIGEPPVQHTACIAVGDPEDNNVERMTYEWEGVIQTERLVPVICFACLDSTDLFFTNPHIAWSCCDKYWTVNGLAAYERANTVDAHRVTRATGIVEAAMRAAQSYRFWNPGGARH